MSVSAQARRLAVPRAATLAAVAAGAAIGIGYAASPLTIWWTAGMALLFWWAGRGLGPRERRLVMWTLAVAVAVRVLAIVGLVIFSHPGQVGSFFWDGDGIFLKKRAIAIRNLWVGEPLGSLSFGEVFYLQYGWTSYLYVLAYLQYLMGIAPYSIHLLNVGLFVTAAIVLHRLTRPAFGAAPAYIGLALTTLLPTLIAWSVAALKESVYVLLCVIAAAAAVRVVRARGRSARAGALLILVGAIAINTTVRVGAFSIMGSAVVLGWTAALLMRRPLAAIAATVLVPIVIVAAWQVPRVQTRIMESLKSAAVIHIGNVHTEGHAYRLLDDRLYLVPGAIQTMTPKEGLRFAIRALVSFVVVPLPSQAESAPETAFLAQQAVWYLMVAFAIVGLIAGLRRDALVVSMLTAFAVMGAGAIALNSGNIGTMVRFRDTIVPFVAFLTGIGACAAIESVLANASRLPPISRRTQEAGAWP